MSGNAGSVAGVPVFYDTHAHLDYPEYEQDFEAYLMRSRAAGILRMISIGTNMESSARAIALAEKYEEVYAAVGWHPCEADDAPEDLRADLRRLAAHPRVVALGETGLDYLRLSDPEKPSSLEEIELRKQTQARVFAQHLEVARETGLNCIIHQRESLEPVIAQLEPFSSRVKSVFHCFVSPPEVQRRLQTMNALVSFTGIVTFKNAGVVRETVKETPMGQFMLETDSPYLAPVPYRGKKCEPAYVKEIAQCVADLKGCSMEALSQATCETAHRFFRW